MKIIIIVTCEQEASATKKKLKGKDTKNAVSKHVDCTEYKSKIWNKTFSDESVIELMDMTLETGKLMAPHEVCSNTIQVFFNFVDEIASSQYAFSTIRMLYKMFVTGLREAKTLYQTADVTITVLDNVLFNPYTREFLDAIIGRTVEYFDHPDSFDRMKQVMVVLQRALSTAVKGSVKN